MYQKYIIMKYHVKKREIVRRRSTETMNVWFFLFFAVGNDFLNKNCRIYGQKYRFEYVSDYLGHRFEANSLEFSKLIKNIFFFYELTVFELIFQINWDLRALRRFSIFMWVTLERCDSMAELKTNHPSIIVRYRCLWLIVIVTTSGLRSVVDPKSG